jgi:putative ABC transport system ATP-binding protein
MIKLEKVTKTYRTGIMEVKALKGIDLEVAKGEFVSIIGPSGSGKSTLLHILGCLDKPTAGKHYHAGVEVQKLDDDQLAEMRNRKIGFIFQFFGLINQLSVRRNLELPLMFADVWPPARRDKIIMDTLRDLMLAEKARFAVNQISGGEQQRVAIGRALVNCPDLLLADEPTGNLDSTNAANILSIFKVLNSGGMTIILVTHDENVAKWARRIITVKDGLIEKHEKND